MRCPCLLGKYHCIPVSRFLRDYKRLDMCPGIIQKHILPFHPSTILLCRAKTEAGQDRGPCQKQVAELYELEHGGMDGAFGKRFDIAKVVGKIPRKRLEILAEAIEELNQDIEEREGIGRQVQDKIDSDVFDLEFEVKELKHWNLGCSDSIEGRRLGLEREFLDLRQQKKGEEIKKK